MATGKSHLEWKCALLPFPPGVKGIKHFMEAWYSRPCNNPMCVQSSAEPHKNKLCANYWSHLISSAPFKTGLLSQSRPRLRAGPLPMQRMQLDFSLSTHNVLEPDPDFLNSRSTSVESMFIHVSVSYGALFILSLLIWGRCFM